jgi:hypothetical protein
MSDITKCSGVLWGDGAVENVVYCPMKDQCYRYTVPENSYRQSYFCEPPIKQGEDGVVSCRHFWKDENE